MPTFAIGDQPKDILAAATLDIDGTASSLPQNTALIAQAYLPTAAGSGGQETFTGPYIHIEDTTAAPTTNLPVRGAKLRHQKSARVSGTNIWVWVDGGTTAYLSVHEAP